MILFRILGFRRLKGGFELGFSEFSSGFLRKVIPSNVADVVVVEFVVGFVSREEGCSDEAGEKVSHAAIAMEGFCPPERRIYSSIFDR